jgi:hypothetical protein
MMIRPIAGALVLVAACSRAPEPPPRLAAAPPPTLAQPPPPVPPPLPPLDRLGRAALNQAAVELALRLFWVADTDGDRSVDPDEIATPWDATDHPPTWTIGGAFTGAFYAAYEALVVRKTRGADFEGLDRAERIRRSLVLAELRQATPSLLRSDFRGASAEDRAIVAHVLAAARIIERIHAAQRGALRFAGDIARADAESRAAFWRNQGPWCLAPLTEKDAACNALPTGPRKISGLYPAALQDDPKFCEALAARKDKDALMHPFAVVVEQGGELAAVPYHLAYADDMRAVARELGAAAAAIESPAESAFKDYLALAARAFTDGSWEAADEAWAKMSVHNSKWYLRIGPDEVYFEPCSQKAGFHVSFARINQASLEWQRKLEPLRTEMEQIAAKMAGPPYRARPVSFKLPDFIDVVLNAGDSRSPMGATIGQSLPNWGPVANEGRGRTVTMTNLYADEDGAGAFRTQVDSLFCRDAAARLPFDPSLVTMSTVLHEAAHNLGPSHEYRVAGKKDRDVFGGPLASLLEELKAQTSAMFYADWLADKGVLSRERAELAHGRDLVWGFGHIAQGMTTAEGRPKPYSQLAAIQAGWLHERGGLSWRAGELAQNGADQGCFAIDFSKLPAAVAALELAVMRIKGRGDKKAALALQKKYVEDDGDWKRLRAVIEERMRRVPKPTFLYAVEL